MFGCKCSDIQQNWFWKLSTPACTLQHFTETFRPKPTGQRLTTQKICAVLPRETQDYTYFHTAFLNISLTCVISESSALLHDELAILAVDDTDHEL